MKLVNSRDVRKMFDEDSEYIKFYNTNEDDEEIYPCFQVSVDKEKGNMIFLVDGQEILSCPLSKLDESYFTIEKISELITVLKTGNLKKLRDKLGIKKRRKK